MKFKNLNDYHYLIKQTYIKISNKKLTSLEGSPKEFNNGGFYCNDNELTSLKYSPEKVNGKFNCRNNKLTTLEDSPKEIYGDFDCSFNNLITLKGAPKMINGTFDCRSNSELKNIKQEIIENTIEAKYYTTDNGFYCFQDLKEEIENYKIFILEKEKIKKTIIKENQIKIKKIINKNDYGLSI